MQTFRVSSTARIHAPAQTAYRLIADYRDGHPRIVPPGYFSNLLVEEGGYGAGTRIRFDATVLGVTEQVRAVIDEPQPGRVLTERDLDRGTLTTFEVVPAGRDECDVTITTEMPRNPGLRGAVERLILGRVLPRIFRLELSRIDEVARTGTGA